MGGGKSLGLVGLMPYLKAPMSHKHLYLPLLGLFFAAAACNKNTTTPAGSGNDTTTGPKPLNISITSIKPISGPYNTIDTITGSGFDQMPAPDSVLLNGKKLTILSYSASEIIVKISLLAGTGDIGVWYKGKLYQGPLYTYDSVLMVTTIAGTTDTGEVDGKGSAARFYSPVGISLDGSGNLYVVDQDGPTIRKIDTGGNVTTIAGTHDAYGFADGTGAVVQFSYPLGLCMGPDGFLYVADQYNYRVRQLSTTGVTSTLAGIFWYGGPLTGEVDGPASVATFDNPWDVTADKNGNIYVADLYNNRIRKVTPAGVVSTFAGGDYYHYGEQDGQGTAALLWGPGNITTDPTTGAMYELDGGCLRKITPDAMVTTLQGPTATGYLSDGNGLFAAGALACDKNGNLFFNNFYGMMKMTPDGTITRYAVNSGTSGVDGPVPQASFGANRMVIDASGTLYFTDNNRVRKMAWQ
jgi:sugar lactone lactonase YvrE